MGEETRSKISLAKMRQHRSNPKLTRTKNPTIQEICWAAGIYEGDGTVGGSTVSVFQKDRWILDKLQTLFGGSVRIAPVDKRYPKNIYHMWRIAGARARGFLMTIYELLSPRRQAQALPVFTASGGK